MATEKRDVKIMAWPKESAKLEHSFDSKKPCPVSIVFEKNPANVVIHTTQDNPFNVDMNMKVTAKDTIPVCVKLCEPICAKSDYTIGIDIFDRPVGTITLKGMTRLFNCREQQEPQEKPVCVDFNNLKEDTLYRNPLTYRALTFSPLGEQIKVGNLGEPAERLKLVFPKEGMRIGFPVPVSDVVLTVNNYSSPELTFSIFSGATLINTFTETVDNEIKHINLGETNVTAVEIKGGNFEASLAQVCYRSM